MKLYRRRLLSEHVCFVCRRHIPKDEGFFHAKLLILTHAGECLEKVKKLERVFDRSRHGRLRPAREILALLDKDAPPEAQPKSKSPAPELWTLTFETLLDKTPVAVRVRRLVKYALRCQRLRCTRIDSDEVQKFDAEPSEGLSEH
jgi:hypothetical protein